MRPVPVLAITLLLGACGSGGGNESAAASGDDANAAASASAQKTDPCSLVTAEEVAAIIGDKVTAKPADDGCVYETADAQASSVTVELDQSDAAGQMDIARRTAGVLKDMGEEAAEQGGAAGQETNAMLSESGDTPRVGDEAFFGANQQLSVRKGSSYLAVSPPMMRSRMSGGNPLLSSDEKKRMAVAIATKAVSRLP